MFHVELVEDKPIYCSNCDEHADYIIVAERQMFCNFGNIKNDMALCSHCFNELIDSMSAVS